MPRVKGYCPGGGASGPASAARYTGFSGNPLSVVGSDGQSAADSGAGLAIRFHELGQDTANALWMDKPDSCAVLAGPRRFIEQLGAAGAGLLERGAHIVSPIGHVMDGLTAILKELFHSGVGTEGGDQLDPAFSDRDHGNLDALAFEPFPSGRPQSEAALIDSNRLIEITNGDPDVVDPAKHGLILGGSTSRPS